MNHFWEEETECFSHVVDSVTEPEAGLKSIFEGTLNHLGHNLQSLLYTNYPALQQIHSNWS